MMYQLCYRIKNTKTGATDSEWRESCMWPKPDKRIVRLAAQRHGSFRLNDTFIRHAFVKPLENSRDGWE